MWDRDINPYTPLHYEDNECDCVWIPERHILDALNRRYRSWGNPQRASAAWKHIAESLGPRRPGGRYSCWGRGYTVESIHYSFYNGDPASPSWKITVTWDDGRRGTHSTPWKPDIDFIGPPGAPHPGPAPEPAELRAHTASYARTGWRTPLARLRPALNRLTLALAAVRALLVSPGQLAATDVARDDAEPCRTCERPANDNQGWDSECGSCTGSCAVRWDSLLHEPQA